MLYTNSQTESTSQLLASFIVPSFTNQWTQLAIEVNEMTVALYFRCMRFSTRQVVRKPIQLHLDDASKLYIANAGPIIGGGFEVGNFSIYLFVCKENLLSATPRRERGFFRYRKVQRHHIFGAEFSGFPRKHFCFVSFLRRKIKAIFKNFIVIFYSFRFSLFLSLPLSLIRWAILGAKKNFFFDRKNLTKRNFLLNFLFRILIFWELRETFILFYFLIIFFVF